MAVVRQRRKEIQGIEHINRTGLFQVIAFLLGFNRQIDTLLSNSAIFRVASEHGNQYQYIFKTENNWHNRHVFSALSAIRFVIGLLRAKKRFVCPEQ